MKYSAYVAITILCAASLGCLRSAKGYVEKGDAAAAAGNYSEAVLNYRKALQKDNQSADAYLGLGLTGIKTQDFLSAYQNLHRAVELRPEHEASVAALGDLLLQMFLVDGRRPQAMYDQLHQLSGTLLKKQPNSIDGLRIKGHLAFVDNKMKEAEGYFRRAAAAHPDRADVQLALVRTLIRDERGSEAEKMAQQLIQSKKAEPPLYDLLYRYYRSSGKLVEAESSLKAKIERFPQSAQYRVQLARHYQESNNDAQARMTLDALLNATTVPDARLAVGDYYFSRGDSAQAMKLYAEGEAASKGVAQAPYQKRQVTVLLGQEKLAEARTVVDRILAASPADGEARRARAAILSVSWVPADFEAGIQLLKELRREFPGDAPLAFQLGLAQARKRDFKEARREFLEAVRNDVTYLPPRYALGGMALGQGNPQETMQQATEILTLKPRDPRGQLLRAAAMTEMKTYLEARRALNDLLQQYPTFIEAHIQLGLLALAEGRYEEAEQIFRKYYDPQRTGLPSMEGLVQTFVSRKQTERGLQVLADEAKKRPNDKLVRLALANLAASGGQYEVAASHYQSLLRTDPNDAGIRLRLGLVYERQGKLDTALAEFQRLGAANAKNPQVLISLAATMERLGRYPEAIDHYRKALEQLPANGMLLNNLAFLLAEHTTSYDEALQLSEKAKKALGDTPQLNDTIGYIYLKRNQVDSALHIFEGLVKKHPQEATYRYHLAVALVRKGDKDRARKELQAALSNNPATEESSKIKQLLASI